MRVGLLPVRFPAGAANLPPISPTLAGEGRETDGQLSGSSGIPQEPGSSLNRRPSRPGHCLRVNADGAAMSLGDREGLISRIRQVRRLAAPRERPIKQAADPVAARLQAAELRLTHLEEMVQGLQDSVHRESERHARLIAELQTQVQPATMSAALAEDARNRGL